MKEIFKISIPGECVGKLRPKARNMGAHIRVYTPEKTTNYENFIKIIAMDELNNGVKQVDSEAMLECHIDIFTMIPKNTSKKKALLMEEGKLRPTKKPDIDNCIKSILDGLNGTIYKDDKQVVSVTVNKYYSSIPKTEVVIYAIE